MAFQTVFKRYELKYMITKEQQAAILRAMHPYMMQDKFGRSTIRNIYFDTDDFILARHSIAKPDFKEKLRIRSYSSATEDTTVFVELKRKFDHVVYKRRVALPEHTAMAWTLGLARRGATASAAYSEAARSGNIAASACSTAAGNAYAPVPTQMTKEIDYFLSYYGHLRPAAFISYDRQAYRMRDLIPELSETGGHDQDFRVTFDENILFRDYDLSLTSEVYGTPVLEEGKVLMELKCAGGIPLWMTRVLSEHHVYKTSFSKYGTAYTRYIQPEQQRIHAAARAFVPQTPAAIPAFSTHDSSGKRTIAAVSTHRWASLRASRRTQAAERKQPFPTYALSNQ